MEWVRGRTLGERLEEAPLPLTATCDVIEQICDALEAAHAKGVIHRDLKPDNVILVDEGEGKRRVKLLDFGLAKLARSEDEAQLTRTGVAMGTPEYLSPEQARGFPVNDRTDIYSLGVMLFEMIFRRLPFSADNAADMLAKHLLETPPAPHDLWPDIPEPLEKLITAMLAKKPEDRPAIGEIRAALARFVSGWDAVEAPTSTRKTDLALAPARPKRRWVRRVSAVAALAGAACAAALVVGGSAPEAAVVEMADSVDGRQLTDDGFGVGGAAIDLGPTSVDSMEARGLGPEASPVVPAAMVQPVAHKTPARTRAAQKPRNEWRLLDPWKK
jgi:serine/threonine-protein kinase